MNEVGSQLRAVGERICAACTRAGRPAGAVRLVAVTKAHGPDAVRSAYEAGQREFGESYVQELVEKASALADLDEVRWRFIGHLQRNKAKDVARLGCSIDTVDSARLAEVMARRAEAASRRLEVLLEVNIGAEAQKPGCLPADVASLLDQVRRHPALDVRGLMAVPPGGGGPEESRRYFRALKVLADEHGLPELSMGMSADLEVAIEEGATMVRVGTDIFGTRRPHGAQHATRGR